MADKVLILSNIPSHVIKEIKINYTNRKNPLENRKCSEFNLYCEEILKEINNSV